MSLTLGSLFDGMVELETCHIEWRVLDAQYWGVPQRRKRIFLVADFAATKRGGREILFECESCLRHSAESRSEGKSPAGEAGDGTKSTSTGVGIEQITYAVWPKNSNGMRSSNPLTGCVTETRIARTLDCTIPEPSKNQGGVMVLECFDYRDGSISATGRQPNE